MLFFLSQNGQWNDAICQNPADGFICKKPMTLMSATPAPEVVGCTFVSHTGVLMYGLKTKLSDTVTVRKAIVKVRFYRNFEDELYESKLF